MTKSAAACGTILIAATLLGFCAKLTLASPARLRLPQDQRRSGAIRVESNLVNILVSVIDAKGEPVADLTQDDFELAEEGQPQKIERFEAQTDRPLDLALMVDSSMSTYKDVKIETDAAAHFIRQVMRP